MIMQKCWELSPKNRPTFRELHSNISKYISCIAGYLEMGFNPFIGGTGLKSTVRNEVGKDVGVELQERGADPSVAIQVIPPSMSTNGRSTFLD